MCQHSRVFHNSHRHASLTHDTDSMHHRIICLKSEVFTSILTMRMVRSAKELFAIEKMGAHGMGNKKIIEAVFSSSTEIADRIVSLKDTVRNTSSTRT